MSRSVVRVGNPVPGRAGLGPGRAAQADPQAIQRLLNRLLVGLVVVRITGIGFVHEVRNATPMRCPTAPGIKIRGPQFPVTPDTVVCTTYSRPPPSHKSLSVSQVGSHGMSSAQLGHSPPPCPQSALLGHSPPPCPPPCPHPNMRRVSLAMISTASSICAAVMMSGGASRMMCSCVGLARSPASLSA